jgi:hypothetical protein
VVAVGDDERAARVVIALEPGEAQLQAWLAGPEGLMQSPYYVEIHKID